MRPLPGAPGVAAAAALLLLLLPRARSDEHEHTVRRSEPRGRPRPAPPPAALPGPGLKARGAPGATPRPPERSFRSGMAGPDPRELGGGISEHSGLPGPCSPAPPLGAGALGSARRLDAVGHNTGGRRMRGADLEIPIASRWAPASSYPSPSCPNRIETVGWGLREAVV